MPLPSKPLLLTLAVLLPVSAGAACTRREEGQPVNHGTVPTDVRGSAATTTAPAPGEPAATVAPPTPTIAATADRPQGEAAVVALLHDTYGVTVSGGEGACVTAAFAREPDLWRALERTYVIWSDLAARIVAAYSTCFGGQPGAAHAIVETMVRRGRLTDAEGPCVEQIYGAVPTDHLVGLLSNDQPTINLYSPQLERCRTGRWPS